MRGMTNLLGPPSIQAGFQTATGATLKRAIADGFGSVLIEVEHAAGESCDIAGLTSQPHFKLHSALKNKPQWLTSSFFISQATISPTAPDNIFSWLAGDELNCGIQFSVAPVLQEKGRFDAAFAELFWRAVEDNLSSAASLVRADKTGGHFRRTTHGHWRPTPPAIRGDKSVALLVCYSGAEPFSLATWVTCNSINYACGEVAALCDSTKYDCSEEDATGTPFNQKHNYHSIFSARDLLAEHEFVLFLSPGTIVSRKLNSIVNELLNYSEMGKLVQLQTNGRACRLDIIAALDAPVMRPRDFPLTAFYPVLARTHDIFTVLAGHRCYNSALSLMLELTRDLQVVEVAVCEKDGILQTAPPPNHFHAHRMVPLIRNYLEATISPSGA